MLKLSRLDLLLSFCLVIAGGSAHAAEPVTTRVVAHRGLLQHAPENTLGNFRACLELRLGFEFDVEVTKDGQLICLHDGTLDRTTNGTGRVSETTLAEIRRLDAGSWFDARFADEKVPTLDEVFKLVSEYPRHDVLIAVDLKAADVEQQIVRLAEKHQVLHRLLFIGITISQPEVRERLKQASVHAQTAAVTNDASEFSLAMRGANADWVYFRYIPSQAEMDQVRGAGKRAFIAGTAVSGHVPENWRHAVEAGIDAILTDYPLELSTTLRQ